MGIVGIVVSVVAVLVVAVAGTGGFLYATDAKVEATVQHTDCAAKEVTIKTKMFGIDHTLTDVPAQQCGLLSPGNFVEYHVRSKHTILYQTEGGKCVYDNEDPGRCVTSPSGIF